MKLVFVDAGLAQIKQARLTLQRNATKQAGLQRCHSILGDHQHTVLSAGPFQLFHPTCKHHIFLSLTGPITNPQGQVVRQRHFKNVSPNFLQNYWLPKIKKWMKFHLKTMWEKRKKGARWSSPLPIPTWSIVYSEVPIAWSCCPRVTNIAQTHQHTLEIPIIQSVFDVSHFVRVFGEERASDVAVRSCGLILYVMWIMAEQHFGWDE